MADIFELACSCLLRVAILLVCLRTSFSGRYIVITAATLLLTILSSIALALLRVFRCSPIAFAWEGWEPNGRDEETGGCLAQDSLAYAASSIDIFLNLALLAMLSHLIFSRIANDTTSWLQNAIAIALGAFGLAVSSFRLHLLIYFFKTAQPVWRYHERIVWMDVEISILTIWACLPIWQSFTDPVPPRDVEETNHLPQITEETNMSETPSTDTKMPRPSLCQRGLFGILARGRPKKPVESNLQLGDKTYGNVRTEIQGGQRFSMISQLTGMIGIQVRTRTIRHVHDSGWDAEKGSARENIEAA
jgi:putative component of membrane protein insertase Oxa1/YidC/SpoIIIJ protein YidD